MPRLWLMTDERVDDETLLTAIRRLPQGSGIIFRHYTLPTNKRRLLFARVRAIAQRRRLVLLLAGPEEIALAWKADGFHGRSSRKCRHARLIHTAPAHDVPELRKAERTNADLLFISPVFPTRSHPNGRTLGPLRFGLLRQQTPKVVIALGGINRRRAKRLRGLGADGWAAIDALT
ncbi:MAG TPA: thiamine phosphate synthase [Rhizorhapis sp.]